MLYDNYFFTRPPFIPANCDKPPTIYSILESIVNYGKEDKTKIKDLAKEGRQTIFDFDYPLSSTITKEDFESLASVKYIVFTAKLGDNPYPVALTPNSAIKIRAGVTTKLKAIINMEKLFN